MVRRLVNGHVIRSGLLGRAARDLWIMSVLLRITDMIQRFVSPHLRTENRSALFLEMLYRRLSGFNDGLSRLAGGSETLAPELEAEIDEQRAKHEEPRRQWSASRDLAMDHRHPERSRARFRLSPEGRRAPRESAAPPVTNIAMPRRD